jgi:hypothetical protein
MAVTGGLAIDRGCRAPGPETSLTGPGLVLPGA